MTDRKTLIGLVASSLSIVWVGCCIRFDGGPQAKAERQDQLAAPIGPGATLRARTDFGSISVTGADADECRVTAEVRAQAPTEEEARQILDQVRVVLEPTPGGLDLRVDKPSLRGNRSVGASFTVTMPRGTALDGHTSFGSIHVQDLTAAVKAHTSFSSVTADRVTGPLRLTTSHGSIHANQIVSQDVVAESSFGRIEVDFAADKVPIPGPSDLQTGSQVTPTNVEAEPNFPKVEMDLPVQNPIPGSLDLRTSHGSIACRQVSAGRLHLRTSFGGIHLECSPSAPSGVQLDAATSHGSITCQAPARFAGSVDLDTSFGHIQAERPILIQGKVGRDHLTGTIGTGTGRIRLKTEFGNVTLR